MESELVILCNVVCFQIEMEKVRRAEASVYKSDSKEPSTPLKGGGNRYYVNNKLVLYSELYNLYGSYGELTLGTYQC